jgi:hypothetical protein
VIWKVNHTVGCNTDVLKLVHATQTLYYSDLFVASYIPLVVLSESSQHFIISLLFTTKPRPLYSPPSLLFGCYCKLFLRRYQAGKLCVNGIMLKHRCSLPSYISSVQKIHDSYIKNSSLCEHCRQTNKNVTGT